MKKIALVVAILFGFGLIFNYGVQARMHGRRSGGYGDRSDSGMMGRRGMHRGGMLKMMAEKLDLSSEQQEKIAELHREHKMEKIAQRAEIDKAKVELQALLDEDDVNRVRVKQKLEEIAKKRAALRFSMIELRLDVKEELTDEQIQKMEEFRAERRRKMMKKRMGEGKKEKPGADHQRRHQEK
jgi:Spy/CpxP family protein refolding chaperone